MHAIPVLKQACLDAFDTEDEPGNPALFFSIVDPGSVLELVKIAETAISDEEVKALHQVIAELGDYIRRTTSDPTSIAITRHAWMLVGLTSR
jgi:hypothetical protein